MTAKTPTNNTRNRTIKKDLFALTIILSVIFGVFLGTRPLSVPDEGRYTEIPRQMVVTDDYVTPRLNGVKYFEKPPFVYWLTSTSIKAFGVNEWALRFWPAFFALLGCLATYLYAQRFYSRNVGITSALVLGTNLLYYAHSRILILDMPLAALLSIALFSFHAAVFESQKQRKFWLLFLFFTCSALALLTKGLVGMIIPGTIILLWVIWSRQTQALKSAFNPLGILLFLAIALPWHILASQATPEFFDFYIIHEQFERFFSTVHNRVQPFWIFVPVVILGLFPWVAFLIKAIKSTIQNLKRDDDSDHTLKFLVAWIAFIFVFFSASNSKLIPYIVPIFPPLAILLGRVISHIWDHRSSEMLKTPTRIFLAFASLIAIAIPIALHEREVMGHAQIMPVAYASVTALLLGMVAVVYFASKHQARALLVSICLTALGTFVPLNIAWVHIEGRSIHSLIQTMKTTLQPEDTIVSWYAYYQDLPPYTNRRIVVVEGFNELHYGTTIEDVSDWMMDQDAFKALYESGKPLYIILNIRYLETFYEFYPDAKNLQVLGRSARDILLTNKALPQS